MVPNPRQKRTSSWSRLTLLGEYALESPLRIASAGDSESVALDNDGRPIIPANSFRGALRAYLEGMLRALEKDQHIRRQSITVRGPDGRPTQIVRTVRLACDSVDKHDDDLNYQGCLTGAIVSRWADDPVLRPGFDAALVSCSCQVCRMFGAPWLAGRVSIADLRVIPESWPGTYSVRRGVTLSRDRDVMIEGGVYSREVVPTGARFTFQLQAQDLTPAEQGLVLLGLRGFENGQIALGADRSRGLGRGRLALDWDRSHYADADQLIPSMLGKNMPTFGEADAEGRIAAMADWLENP
jgi:CRISPR/Cas system CSM-associated protein Csm3 (group 7 of RAMP superfamily)